MPFPSWETSCNPAIAKKVGTPFVFPNSRTNDLNRNETYLCLESSWESSDVVGQLALVAQELDVCTINQDLASSLLLHVLFTAERSEPPILGNDNLLATWELVLRTAESFESGGTVRITSSDTQDDLTDVDTGNSSVGLAPGTTHSSLQSIGTGARQHLVDTDDVVWVSANTEMETFLSGNLDQVLVGANTGSFQSLGAQLFILVGDHVNAEGELVDVRTLSAKIEDTDLGVGDTTVESGLRVWLVLAVTVTSRGTTSHLECWK
jgi:hypothetical protein